MIIKNGTIYDGIHPAPYAGDLALREGVIAAIGPGLEPVEGERVLDAAGRRVYPGFVDAHSHLGLDGYGMGREGIDYNEMGDIVSAHLRGIDAFNPRTRPSPWPAGAASPPWAPARAAPTCWGVPSSR